MERRPLKSISRKKPIKEMEFPRSQFCDVGLQSKKDQTIQYASRDILVRNSKLFQVIFEGPPSNEDFVIQLEASSKNIWLLLYYFYERTIDLTSLKRDDICELIFLAHYIDSDIFLKMIISHYERNFNSYGIIDIQQLENIPHVFNAYPSITELYIHKHIMDMKRNSISDIRYEDASHGTLVKIIKHLLNVNNKSKIDAIYDRKGREIVMGIDRRSKICLAIIKKKDDDKYHLHFYGWASSYDECVDSLKVFPLVKDGIFYTTKCLWDSDTIQHVFDSFYSDISYACKHGNIWKQLLPKKYYSQMTREDQINSIRKFIQEIDDIPFIYRQSKPYQIMMLVLEDILKFLPASKCKSESESESD